MLADDTIMTLVR